MSDPGLLGYFPGRGHGEYGVLRVQSPCFFSIPGRHQADGTDELPPWRKEGEADPSQQDGTSLGAPSGRCSPEELPELAESPVVIGCLWPWVPRKLSVSVAPGANTWLGRPGTTENQVGDG